MASVTLRDLYAAELHDLMNAGLGPSGLACAITRRLGTVVRS
jgi:hypothetical protein